MNLFAGALSTRKTPAVVNFAKAFSLKNPLSPDHPLIRTNTGAGIKVNSDTALTLSAYFHGVNLISNHLAMLPFSVYRPESAGSENVVKVRDHSVTQRLHYEADPQTSTAFQARKVMNIHMLNWGNGFARVFRSGNRIERLKVINPWDMRIFKDQETDELYYKITGDDKMYRWWEILHVFQFSTDGLTGRSVVEFARDRFGGHLAAEKYGEAFFGNGTHMGGMLISKQSFGSSKEIADEAKSEIRKEIEQIYNGPENYLRIGIFDGEMEYEPLTMPAADAQLIERMKFSVDDVSRWLGIPPHKLMSLDRSTNNNIEHQGIEYVQDSIQPRATMWEQETRRRLLTEEEKRQGMYTKMNMNAILRGDTKTRGEFYKAMIDRAVFSPADVLRMEDMNTYPGSEKHMMPQNFQIVEDGDDNA
jgi:HK97 family phage portal protein